MFHARPPTASRYGFDLIRSCRSGVKVFLINVKPATTFIRHSCWPNARVLLVRLRLMRQPVQTLTCLAKVVGGELCPQLPREQRRWSFSEDTCQQRCTTSVPSCSSLFMLSRSHGSAIECPNPMSTNASVSLELQFQQAYTSPHHKCLRSPTAPHN